jgi:hypothetical protein
LERVNIYEIHQKSTKAFIAVGFVFFILGIAMLISYSDFDSQFPSNDWNSIIYMGQGIIFILIGIYNLKYKKYFIEWDDNKIRYFLKADKKINCIEISNIKAVEIKINKVFIQTYDNPKAIELNFEQIEYKKLKKIKGKFEALNSALHKVSIFGRDTLSNCM